MTFPLAAPSLRERRAVFVISIAFLLLISLPYLLAATDTPPPSATPPGSVYGGLLYNADDQNVTLSWAKQARDGHFFFRDLFTHESLSARPLFTNAFCLLMGAMSHLMPLLLAYHLLRVLFAGLALWWFWKLTRRVSDSPRVRVCAVALAAFGGGTGPLLAPVFPNATFIDKPDGALMMPEAWTFDSALIFPLFIASMALLVLIYERVLERGTSPRRWLMPFLAAMLLANIHTYDAIPLGFALLTWTFYEFARARKLKENSEIAPDLRVIGAVLVGMAVPTLYQLVVFRGSEEFRIKALTVTAAPPISHVALSYGPLLLLAIVGAAFNWNSRGVRLMAFWVLTTFACVYAPVSFARKMIEGVHLPLCLLASLGAWSLLARVKSPLLPRVVVAGLVALLSVSSLNFLLWCVGNAEENNKSRLGVYLPPLYLPPNDAAALHWLNDSREKRGHAVLCMPWLGNYVPRETGRAVYIGHWAETLNFYNEGTKTGKVTDAQRFYGAQNAPQMSPDEARAWLRRNNIGFVVLGFYERTAGGHLPLSLPLAHREGETEIYKAD